MLSNYPYKIVNLTYVTHHLRHFSILNKIIALHGRSYLPLKKAVWYTLLGATLKRKLCLGEIITDTRVNLAVCIKSGQGKKNIARTIKDICKRSGISFSSPNSLYPEQLVGKTKLRSNKKDGEMPEQIEGHLADDFLLLDEAIEFMRSKEPLIVISRSYINVALDPIGHNEIQKRMVNFKKEDTLNYTPRVTIALFFQPYRVSEEVVIIGFMRRFLAFFIKPLEEDMKKVFKNRLCRDSERESSLSVFSDFLKDIKKSRSVKRTFTKEAIERVSELHNELIRQGFNFSIKGKNYTEIAGCTLQDSLVKMSYIQACVEDSDAVEDWHVELAYMDLVEFLASTLVWLEEKIIGDMDYGEAWCGAVAEDKLCLQWLDEKEGTNVRISEYWDNIAEIYSVSIEQARKIYYKHVRNGWVEGKQRGKHDSTVRLKIKPPVKGAQGGKGGKGDPIKRPTEYEKIVKKLIKQPP